MRPKQMPAALADLHERASKGEQFQEWIGRMLVGQFRYVGTDERRAKACAAMVVNLIQHSSHAECFYVTEDMTTLVRHAAAGLDDTDQVDFRFAPAPRGLVYFEGTGLPIIDVHGSTMMINWILWHPAIWGNPEESESPDDDEGFLAWEFNDALENPDEIEERVLATTNARLAHRVYGRWGFISVQSMVNGMRLGPAVQEPTRFQTMRILMNNEEPTAATNTSRFLHALWLLMDQTVTDVSEVKHHPSERKAAKRAKTKLPKITLIELRRRVRQAAAATGGEATSREYTHRWIVRGHWRWQAYGPKWSQRRRQWIDPHVAGPDDKPLVETQHVYELKR